MTQTERENIKMKTVIEIPDDIRIPLHSLQADLGYLLERYKDPDDEMTVHCRMSELLGEIETAVLSLLEGLSRDGMSTSLYDAIERILDEHSAWIARPNPEVTRAISIRAAVAADEIAKARAALDGSDTDAGSYEAGFKDGRKQQALDGGAVSRDAVQLAQQISERLIDYDDTAMADAALPRNPFSCGELRKIIATLRTPQPQQDEARDLLIRFATWFDRCSERPLHAHEISDSIDAFLAAQDNPCWTDDQIARGVDKAFDRLVSAPQPDEGRDLRLIAFVRHPQKCEWGLGREGDKQALDSFLAAEKEPRE